MPFSQQFVSELSEFLQQEIAQLDKTYIWPTGVWDGFSLPSDMSRYKATLELKKKLNADWQNPDRRSDIAAWVVGQWGGIRRNSEKTLDTYVKLAEETPPATPFKGVSSYSKILSIAEPDRYAIYDSRVAVALNALQIALKLHNCIYFPVPQSQNRLVREFCDEWPPAFFIEHGWGEVAPNDCYETYLRLLRACLINMRDPQVSLAMLEMALFTAAEHLITYLWRSGYWASFHERNKREIKTH